MKRDRIRRMVTTKERLRDAQKTAVATAGREVELAERMLTKEREARDLQMQRLTELEACEASEIRLAADLVRMAERRVLRADEVRHRMEDHFESLRADLTEATHDVKRVQSVEARLSAQEDRERRRREQRDEDELASRTRRTS